jgi:hypothetical protein
MRTLVVATVALLVVAGVAIPVAGSSGAGGSAAATADASTQTTETGDDAGTTNGSNASAGTHLAGAFASQQSDLGGDLAERRLVLRLGSANTTAERLAVLLVLRDASERRLSTLEARRSALRDAAENGSVTPGEFAATVATVRSEARTTARLADRGGAAARRLPDRVAVEYGVTADRFHERGVAARDLETNLTDGVTVETVETLVGDWTRFEATLGDHSRLGATWREETLLAESDGSLADGTGDLRDRLTDEELATLLEESDLRSGDRTDEDLLGDDDTDIDGTDLNETDFNETDLDETDLQVENTTDDLSDDEDDDTLLDG